MKFLFIIATLALFFSSDLRASIIPVSSTEGHFANSVRDSVGVERRDGKLVVLHQVNQGQTLYAIARRYNTSVEVLKAANPGLTDAVKYNQIVRVPQPQAPLSRKEERTVERAAKREEKAAKRAAKENDQLMKKAESAAKTEPTSKVVLKTLTKAPLSDVHVVETGQTLYSIAVKNNVLMTNIRRWNNLNNDTILLGQALIVSEKGFAARQTGNDADLPATPTKTEPKRENAKKESAKSDSKPESGTKLPTKGRRMAEMGMAERIEADESSNKYLALHRSAPVGALVQVRNDISNQSLWVKVIGRLPNTGVNDRVLIKLSAKAFEKLSPNNQSFRTEVSYMVP